MLSLIIFSPHHILIIFLPIIFDKTMSIKFFPARPLLYVLQEFFLFKVVCQSIISSSSCNLHGYSNISCSALAVHAIFRLQEHEIDS